MKQAFDGYQQLQSITMTTLPLAVVTHIFQALADSEADPFTWGAPTDAYRAFFTAVSLVCRAWRDLALPYRRLFYVRPKPKQVTVEEWDREIHELAKSRICFRAPGQAGQLLHIERMDLVGPHLQVSKNLSLVFLGGKDQLEALSI